jgi:hypothetical protein
VFSLLALWLLIALFAETLTVFCSSSAAAEKTSDLARKKLHVLLPLSDKAHVPVLDCRPKLEDEVQEWPLQHFK